MCWLKGSLFLPPHGVPTQREIARQGMDGVPTEGDNTGFFFLLGERERLDGLCA